MLRHMTARRSQLSPSSPSAPRPPTPWLFLRGRLEYVSAGFRSSSREPFGRANRSQESEAFRNRALAVSGGGA